jgi:C4-dicarboxylate transporter DctM subunit
MITPPVGLNLYVISGITGHDVMWAVRSALPWLGLMLVGLGLITYIPQISMFLPEYLDSLRGYK